jgi:DNA repair exonuclease SbcCD ATPase subunit|nr:MAG TPA: tail tape measure [Caudoviricetes sp.]
MAGPTINTKIKLDGEAEYKQAVKEINAALGNLDSKLKNLDETYKDSEGSVEGLTKKNEVLNQKILTQKEKIDELRKMVQSAGKSLSEHSTATQNYQKQLNNAETALLKMEKALRDNTKQLKDAGVETDNFSGGLEDLEEKTGSAEKGLKDLTKTEEEGNKKTKTLGDLVKTLGDKFGINIPEGAEQAIGALGNVSGAAVAMAGSMAAAVTAIAKVEEKLKSMTEESGKRASDIQDLAMTYNMTTDTIQEMTYAGELMGVGMDTITDSIKDLTKNLYDAYENGGDTLAAFSELGVEITNTDGSLRNANAVFMDVIDALGGVENYTERDAKAMALLNESAQKLNPLIKQGSSRLREYAQEARDTGYVMGSDMLDTLDKVDTSMRRYNLQIEAGENAMSAEFAPALTEFNNKFGETFSQLAKDASESGLIEVFATLLDIVTALSPALEAVGDVLIILEPIFKITSGVIATAADGLRVIFDLVEMITGPLGAIFSALFNWDFSDLGDKIDKAYSEPATDLVNTLTYQSGSGARLRGNAAGTDNWAGGWTRVNENGLERIYLPSGSRIQTASETRYTSGDTYNTTVYVDHVEDLDTILRIAKNARITARMGAK